MKTLAQFKQEQNVTSIDMLQGTKRAYATVRDHKLFVASKTDLSKPLFVSELRRPNPDVVVAEDTLLDNSNSVVDPKSHWLVNSNVKTVATI